MPAGYSPDRVLPDALVGSGGVEGFLSQAPKASTATRPMVVANALQR